MKADEREEAHRKLFRYVSQYTASHWGTEFVAELQRDRAERRAIAEASDKDEAAAADAAQADRDQRAKQEQLRRQGLQLTGKA